MSDRGKFSGFSWHNEYHSELKKGKPADCVFLSVERVCENKKSVYYMNKCFVASICPLRQKENELAKISVEAKTQTKPAKKVYKCTIPLNTKIITKKGVIGTFVKFITEKQEIVVSFNGSESKYLYPDAFIKGFLFVEKSIEKNIENDIKEAE